MVVAHSSASTFVWWGLLCAALLLSIKSSSSAKPEPNLRRGVAHDFQKLVNMHPLHFYNMSRICQRLGDALPSVGLRRVLEETYLSYELQAGYFSRNRGWSLSPETATAWIQVMNHFLGAWALATVGVDEALSAFGEYVDCLHGALTMWGWNHPYENSEQFWVAVFKDFGHAISANSMGHSIGHAAFMSVVARWSIDVQFTQRPATCYFPINYKAGFIPNRLNSTYTSRAAVLCDHGPSFLHDSCLFGVFHSMRAYLSSWYSTCHKICASFNKRAQMPCAFHCTSDFGDLSALFDSNRTFFALQGNRASPYPHPIP